MPSQRQMNAAAAAVSRTLRRGGLNPLGSGTPRSREGIRVSRGWFAVRVSFDIDDERLAEERRTVARAVLGDAGYIVEVTPTGALLARRS